MSEIAADVLVRKLEETIMERESALSELEDAQRVVASMVLERTSLTEHADRVEADNAYLRTYSTDCAAKAENSEAWASALWETMCEQSPEVIAAERVDDAKRMADLEQRTVMRCVQALNGMAVLSGALAGASIRQAAEALKAGAWKHFSGEVES